MVLLLNLSDKWSSAQLSGTVEHPFDWPHFAGLWSMLEQVESVDDEFKMDTRDF